jgi:hypothetical protein
MRQGYLLIETHPDFPGRVRLFRTDRLPAELAEPDSGKHPRQPRIRYAALFNDLDVAAMHAHTALRRSLIDIDASLYRTDPVRAIAAVESIGLRHRQIYLDPDVAADPALGAEVTRRQAWLHRRDRIWHGIGILALVLLLLKLVLGI